jgi:hypothetical protein
MINAAIEALENFEDFTLFDSKMLGTLEKSQELMPYLCAILRGTKNSESEEASKRRLICFQKAVVLLKIGRLPDQQSKELLDR